MELQARVDGVLAKFSFIRLPQNDSMPSVPMILVYLVRIGAYLKQEAAYIKLRNTLRLFENYVQSFLKII